MFKCSSCSQGLTLPYIKCAECTDSAKYVYLCPECHGKNYSNRFHDSSHDYLSFEPKSKNNGLTNENIDENSDSAETHEITEPIQESGCEDEIDSDIPGTDGNGDTKDNENLNSYNTKQTEPIIYGDSETPTLLSSDLGPLNNEIEFLNFISKYGLNSKCTAKEFISRYPKASCVKNKRKLIEAHSDLGVSDTGVKPAKIRKHVTWRSANVCTPRFGITWDLMVRST